MPFAELVDLDKEIERLEKEEEKLAKELSRVTGMLSNEKFVSKAPEAKIAEMSPSVTNDGMPHGTDFATSHPKDMSDRLLEVMASKPNICRCIHLPAQSGSSRMLEKMNRKHRPSCSAR